MMKIFNELDDKMLKVSQDVTVAPYYITFIVYIT